MSTLSQVYLLSCDAATVGLYRIVGLSRSANLCRVHLDAIQFNFSCSVQQIEISDRRTLAAFHTSQTHKCVYCNIVMLV